MLDLWHYLHTIEIAATKGVLVFIYVSKIQRGKQLGFQHTIEIAANKGFSIFISLGSSKNHVISKRKVCEGGGAEGGEGGVPRDDKI